MTPAEVLTEPVRADLPGTIEVLRHGEGPSGERVEPGSICIVDDDAAVRNSTVQLLDSDGFGAQGFEDAEDFLAYARSHPVPLAILDVWMPKTSGLEVLAQLRVVSPKTKVIVITAREIPAIRAAVLEGGAFAFLTKPFEDEAFLSLVYQALGLAA